MNGNQRKDECELREVAASAEVGRCVADDAAEGGDHV